MTLGSKTQYLDMTLSTHDVPFFSRYLCFRPRPSSAPRHADAQAVMVCLPSHSQDIDDTVQILETSHNCQISLTYTPDGKNSIGKKTLTVLSKNKRLEESLPNVKELYAIGFLKVDSMIDRICKAFVLANSAKLSFR